ncbi:N-acetylmuramoyl-L-alanine amidase [Erysipelothrix sp. HDW6C]|uniref:N-acetylmuramoyl-L-alanine amidase n=1 Tax=Erysipelothrix sp. HDW6C TaxID=2714930 RepID=UPI00140A73F2|nr:N-acetylmuramoyl-L-alanine amidase [Erysipelothrix sp. HDW6C]QIK69929.1 N-acetylmuramoyl-L-alanine amidase [Erysipelothrix sp. HDW6C]
MEFKTGYVPKVRKVNYKIVVPFLLILATLISVVIVTLTRNNGGQGDEFTICKMSGSESRALVKKGLTDDVVEFADYGSYGQTLGLYKNEYKVGEADPFNGRTVFLKNLCSGVEQTFMMGLELDSKIPMETLEPGFYEIQILDGFTRSRIVANAPIDALFESVSRQGEHKQVRLLANQTLFDYGDDSTLDKAYAYLEVNAMTTPSNQYDVVLDPNGLYDEYDGYITSGVVDGDFIEADEMYDVAEGVQKILQDNGYRAMISRKRDQEREFHGNDGRIHAGYQAGAKYYVHLSMLSTPYPNTKGASVVHSNFSSPRLANTIMGQLLANTSLPGYDYGYEDNIGVINTALEDGFDYNSLIREAGGKFTGAAEINDDYKRLNAFALGSDKGMQSVLVEFGYISDAETKTVWTNEKQQIIETLAAAIMTELGK